MSVSRMAGELHFMNGKYYDVIDTIENCDLSKNSTFEILALSHLAVGNFVNFYKLMDPYVKGEMFFIDLKKMQIDLRSSQWDFYGIIL